MSIFFFSLSVFYPFGELSTIFIKFKIVICKCFEFHFTYILMPLDSLGEHRAATTLLQQTRFWEVLLSSVHFTPAAFTSASTLLRQVCFGWPTFHFPCGFQARACLVMFDAGLHSVWPIHPHFLLLMSVSIKACLVLSHSCSLETTSGHLVLRMLRRHLLVKACG